MRVDELPERTVLSVLLVGDVVPLESAEVLAPLSTCIMDAVIGFDADVVPAGL